LSSTLNYVFVTTLTKCIFTMVPYRLINTVIRGSLYHRPWTRPTEDALFRGTSSWSTFHGPSSKKMIYKAVGPLIRCNLNRMWTKRIDHATRSGCADFYNISPKRAILGKIKVWPFSCLLLGFTCFHFLLNLSKMWLENLLTTISTKKWAI
jgi:hypothetical protein